MSTQLSFGAGNQLLKAAATVVGGAAAAGGIGSSVGGGAGLLALLATVAPIALPVLAVGGAIVLMANLASEDEKKEGNK